MKVALVFPGCHRRGGVERVVFECARFLASRGHQVHVIANEWEEDRTERISYHPVALPSGPSSLRCLAFYRGSTRRLQSLDVDVASTHGSVCPVGGVAWVHSVHRAWWDRSRSMNPPFSRARVKRRLNPLHAVLLRLEARHYLPGNYQKLIAMTPDVRDDLRCYYGVPPEKVVIVPNGFSPGEFNPTRCGALRAATRGRLGYRDTQKVVLFVANELERKGFQPLLRAIAALWDPRVCLLAVGRLSPGGCSAEIAHLGLAGRVHFAGPAAEVAPYYAAADVFALPTHYEAWGLVIVEALACGLPVLTSRLAGAARVVREGETGELLADPGSVDEVAAKLRSLLQGAHCTPDAIAASVQDYAWPRVLCAYEEVLLQNSAEAADRGSRQTEARVGRSARSAERAGSFSP